MWRLWLAGYGGDFGGEEVGVLSSPNLIFFGRDSLTTSNEVSTWQDLIGPHVHLPYHLLVGRWSKSPSMSPEHLDMARYKTTMSLVY